MWSFFLSPPGLVSPTYICSLFLVLNISCSHFGHLKFVTLFGFLSPYHLWHQCIQCNELLQPPFYNNHMAIFLLLYFFALSPTPITFFHYHLQLLLSISFSHLLKLSITSSYYFTIRIRSSACNSSCAPRIYKSCFIHDYNV